MMMQTKRVGIASALALSLGMNFVAVALPLAQATPGPGGSTVLTLDPAFFPLPTTGAGAWLRGSQPGGLFVSPNEVVKVQYTNFPAAVNIQNGADKLNLALHSTAGPKIVVGHSEGAEVEDAWLRKYGPTSDIDPATVRFILTGDPESRNNGCDTVSDNDPINPQPVCTPYKDNGGLGLPADTRYNVTVISRQYDYFADCPNPPAGLDTTDQDHPAATAMSNRQAANSVGGKGELKAVHLDYSAIGISDPLNKTYTNGNVTYVLGSPATYYLPMVTKEWGTAAVKQADDLRLRPIVEKAYKRLTGLPPTPPAS
jgi:hypothetical protein